MAFKGIDVRQSGDRIIIRASLKKADGTRVTSGSATLRLAELQSDGSFKSYDFADNTFKTGALTSATLSLTVRSWNNNTFISGVWTGVISTLTGFTRGNIYVAQVAHSTAIPIEQEREFQYGEGEGDLTVASTGQAAADMQMIASSTAAATGVSALAAQFIVSGTLQTGDVNLLTLQTGQGAAWWANRVYIQITNGAGAQQARIVGSIINPGSTAPQVVPITDFTIDMNAATYDVFILVEAPNVWSESLPGSFPAGSAGQRIGDYLNSDAATLIGNLQASVDLLSARADCRAVAPAALQKPAVGTGTTSYNLQLFATDAFGNMQDADVLPTVTAKNNANVDRSANLGTVVRIAQGVYNVTYSVDGAAAAESLAITWTISIGGIVQQIVVFTMVSETIGDVHSIAGNTAAASNLSVSARGMLIGTAVAGTLSTTVMTTNVTVANVDQVVGGTLVWVTGQLAGVRRRVNSVTTAGRFGFAATPVAPSATDLWVVV